jgi:Fe-S cluster assembly protein SufD
MSISTIPSAVSTNGKLKIDRAKYLADLLARRAALPADLADVTWLSGLRDRAFSSLASLKLPSTRDEEWRFTDLDPLLKAQFAPAAADLTLADIDSYLLPDTARLVFVNGVFAPTLSATAALPDGVFVGSLAQALSDAARSRQLQTQLANLPGESEVFTALNTASFIDAAVVLVPKNVEVATRVHVLFVSTANNTVSHPRLLVTAAAHSRISLIEDYVVVGEDSYFANAVTEVAIAENADVIHTRVQRDGAAAIHIGKTAVTQARDSRYTCNAICLGAQLTRHHLEIYQRGEQTQTTLNGLTFIRDQQVSDTHSAIALTAPYGTTRQLHKCIVDDRAHAVFNGKVFVPQAAQQTDAGQLHRTLLLSPKSRVDTKPQLEIVADNVKCTHGAAVGQLSADELFYLQSRGIDLNNARSLLIYAFAYEILEHIAIDALRAALIRWVMAQSALSTRLSDVR